MNANAVTLVQRRIQAADSVQESGAETKAGRQDVGAAVYVGLGVSLEYPALLDRDIPQPGRAVELLEVSQLERDVFLEAVSLAHQEGFITLRRKRQGLRLLGGPDARTDLRRVRRQGSAADQKDRRRERSGSRVHGHSLPETLIPPVWFR
jgi:hypothetical protein